MWLNLVHPVICKSRDYDITLNNHQFSSLVSTGLRGFSSILICRFSLYLLFISRVFPSIDPLSGFSPQSPVIGLGGYSPMT